DLKDDCRKMIVRVYRMAKKGSYTSEFESVAKYVDWVTRIPWGVYSEDRIDLQSIREELDRYHFGLGKVKEKILSYMAVIQLQQMNQGTSGTLQQFDEQTGQYIQT